MEFIPVRDLRLHPGRLWKKLGEGQELVITAKGRPIALLTDIGGGDVERALRALRLAKAQLALSRIHEEARGRGVDRLSEEQIDHLIKKTRRERRRTS